MDNFKVTVPGIDFELESNKTYRIEGRVDPTSPLGFQEQGISKFQHPLNSEGAVVVFNAQRNIWDTGLYEASPCYSKYPELAKKNIKVFDKFIKEHLEITLPDGALSPKANNKYWDDYSFAINQPLTIRTSTPENFLGMWFALLGYTVAPKEKEGFPIYREMNTSFTVVDKQSRSTNKQNMEFARANATASFINLINDDEKDFLAKVMDYAGFKGNVDTEPSILNSQFEQWINNKKDSLRNAKYFNDAIERFSSEQGREELELYDMLKKAVKQNKVTYSRSEYFLGEDSLGTNLKESAKMINESEELKSRFIELTQDDN